MAKGAYVGIPTSYTPVEYIESTGTQYIKTGIMQSDIGKVEAQAYNTFGLVYNTKTYGGSLFGARVSSTDSVFQYASGADSDFVGNGTSQVSLTKNTNTDLLTLNYTKTSYSITCGNYSASGSLNVTIATPKEAYLFGMNNDGVLAAGTWKIKTFKIYDLNNELVRDYIPALDYNNVACLYDQVEGKFYYNQGSGTFTAGTASTPVSIGDRARKISKMYVGVPTSYTPIEYIESTGTQYIDTGIYPYQTQTEVKFGGTSLSVAGIGDIAGCWSSDNNRYYVCAYVGSTSPTKFWSVDRSNTAITLLSPADTSVHTVIYNDSNNKVFFDGVEKGTVSDLTTQVANQILLFARMGGNGAENYYTGRIYYAKIYDKSTNVLVRNYIPVLDDNNVACLYDQVEGKFYYNENYGAFVAGNITGQPVNIGDVARKITKAYVGVNGVARLFYAPFKQIDYIESTGTQYIDTGFKHNQNTRMVLDIDVDVRYAQMGGYVDPFGSWGGSSSNKKMFGSELNQSQDKIIMYYGNGASTTTSNYTGRRTWDFNKNVWKIDTFSYTFTAQTFQSEFNDLIFTCSAYSGLPGGTKTRMKLYSCKIYDDGVLVRDYIPVIDSSNVACLYEQVEKKFYYNQGTGQFIPSETDQWEKLNYVESTGTQYIDTKVFANPNTRVYLDQVTTYYSYQDRLIGANPGGNFWYEVYINGGRSYAFAYQDNSGNWVSTGCSAGNNIRLFIDLDGVAKTVKTASSTSSQIYSNSLSSYTATKTSLNTIKLIGTTETSYPRAKMRVNRCDIYDNGTQVRMLIPVRKKSDQTICMYDMISKQFFYNAGTGTFSFG